MIVLSSTGPHFSAGLDLTSFGGAEQPPEGDEKKRKLQAAAAFYDNVLHMQGSFNCIEEARIPVLACIQGGAIGGGVDLITACDIRENLGNIICILIKCTHFKIFVKIGPTV